MIDRGTTVLCVIRSCGKLDEVKPHDGTFCFCDRCGEIVELREPIARFDWTPKKPRTANV